MGDTVVKEVEAGGVRLDVWLTSFPQISSRSFAQKLIQEGRVKVNGAPPAKAGQKLRIGDLVEVSFPPPVPAEPEPEAIPLEIVFEDEHLLVVNKPSGMVVHPAPGHTSGTLVNALLHHCRDLPGIGGVKRPGIVHRLDKETSGLLVVAKTEAALIRLAQALKERRVERNYLALVEGVVPVDRATIDAPIARHPVKRQQMAVVEGGRPSRTHLEVLERFPGVTYLKARLETGRTHQIRVHMAYIGHPVVGDERYGAKTVVKELEGHALHAAELAFAHPVTGENLKFTAPLPAGFAAYLRRLRKGR